jgi:SAM-dependent methyltransferase
MAQANETKMRRVASTSPLYHDDLAHIHVDGYGFHWSGAAEAILDWFRQFGVTKGKVVDLGCGGGQWLARVAEEGYETCGIDASESMIRLAKRNAPAAEFLCGSFADVAIPECDAATSLGEPLNYLNSGPAMRRTLRKVFTALRPGGVFIFDVRHPATGPVPPRDHHKLAEDWFCHARIEEDYRKNELRRYITTFRRTNDGHYRRDKEVHRLKVFSRDEVTKWLRKIGFRVRTRRAYGAYKLALRQSVFICRKP